MQRERSQDMGRVRWATIGVFCALGVISFALAQGGDVYVTPSPVVCATLPAATPSVGVAVEASPVACDVINPAPVIELFDLGFAPNAFTIAADVPVTITLHNAGVALHNFSVDGLGISQNVLPGETKTVRLTARAGDYPFSCDVPGHKEAGMVGLLRAR
jgi:uncharacterized cupredoxin-like copper-binding protein